MVDDVNETTQKHRATIDRAEERVREIWLTMERRGMNASEKAAANRAARGIDPRKVVIFVDADRKRPGLPEYDQTGRCPKCGGETETGFGLAGGGYGVYAYCSPCGIVTSKSETPE